MSIVPSVLVFPVPEAINLATGAFRTTGLGESSFRSFPQFEGVASVGRLAINSARTPGTPPTLSGGFLEQS